MRHSTLVWSLLWLTVACSPALQADKIRPEHVTLQQVKGHRADKPYVVGVTRGTLLEVAPDVDPSLVQVRDSAGTVPLSVLARRFAGSGTPILIGTLDDLNAHGFGLPPDVGPPGVAASCDGPTANSPGICNCTWRRDCKDMDHAGLCAGGSNKSAVCGKDKKGHWGCSCLAKGS
jgi:hypothetical protein